MSVAPSKSPAKELRFIETPRLTLRPLQWTDTAALVEGLGDPGVSQMLAQVPHPYAAADAESFVAIAATQNATGENLHLGIVHEDRVIGGISLHGLPEVADFGYWLARHCWGKGFATESAAALLRHAFRTIGARRVPSGVFFDNPASLRVQEKLGFERVGVSRRHSLARGYAVEHIDTVITRSRFDERWP